MSQFEPKPFGKYFLMDKLAVGGMAEIYKAKTFGVDGFEKLLAIKKILPHCSADKEFIAMLTDEAKLAVKLSHTNIVQIYDLGKVGDDYYISMEFIDGVNLRDLINRAKELKESIPIPLCLYIVSEICKGLDYAHSKRDENSRPLNIVHRDISPQNILISFEGETKIVDFGIAKAAMNMSQTTSGILKGKVTYMSPEQALGKSVDHRTDIFSAGLILYELLTGNKLFSGESQFQVLKQIQTLQVRADTLPNTLPPDIRHIMAQAMSHNLEKRFETAGDFQIALTKLLYTKYSDFSPKQLSGLIQKWFAQELKIRQIQIHEKTSGATKTEALTKQPAQETIVQRSAEVPSPEKKMMDTTQSEHRIKGIHFKSFEPPLPRLPRRLPVIPILLLVLLMGAGYFIFKKFVFPQSKQGQLQILSDPVGAEVFLNGQDLAETTPYLAENIPLRQPTKIHLEKEGFEPWDREVRLENKEMMTIQATLNPRVEPKSGDLPLHSDSPEVKVDPVLLASLSITSNPTGAQITLDGKDIGQVTPVLIDKLEFPKIYHLQLNKKDYQIYNQDVEIKNTDTIKINATLKSIPKTGRVTIQSNVEGASLSINGQSLGPLPFTYEGTPGSLKIVLTKKGYKSSEKKIVLHEGNNEPITIALTKEQETMKSPAVPKNNQQQPPSSAEETRETGGVLGQVRIDSNPRGASVIFDGSKAGITPIVVRDVAKGKKHTLELALPGYQTWSNSFELKKSYIEISHKLQKN